MQNDTKWIGDKSLQPPTPHPGPLQPPPLHPLPQIAQLEELVERFGRLPCLAIFTSVTLRGANKSQATCHIGLNCSVYLPAD